MSRDDYRTIPGFGAYHAFPDGTIRKINRHEGGEPVFRTLATRDDGRGYLCCDVMNDEGVVVTRKVHRLVYAAFNGPIPDDVHIDHINGSKTDNAICNLRKLCPSTNSSGGRKTSRKGMPNLTAAKKQVMEAAFTLDLSTKQIADALGIGLTTVRRYRKAFKQDHPRYCPYCGTEDKR